MSVAEVLPAPEMPDLVQVGASQYPVVLPGLCEREELAYAFTVHRAEPMPLRRVHAAVVGLCTSAAAGAKVPYRFDVLDYGGRVYSYLREQGADIASLRDASTKIMVPMMKELFPREVEVAAAADFSGPDGDEPPE